MNSRKKAGLPALAASVLAVMAFVSCAEERVGTGARLVDIGSHRLETRIAGSGTPVVVLDAGLGDSLDKIGPFQDRLAASARVFAYNRAGYGRSGPGPLPRDCGREAEELKSLLDQASLPGPFVLVGHSLGALNVQAFASIYPSDVAGLVLLDPPPLPSILGRDFSGLKAMADQMTSEWQAGADAGAASSDPGERKHAGFLAMIASEHREMFGASARLAEAIPGFGSIPLAVIGAGKPNPAFGAVAGDYQKFWIEQNRILSEKSAGGKFVLAESSSHDLFADAPGLVEKEVLDVVEAARKIASDRAAAAPIVEKCAQAMGGWAAIKSVRALRLEVVYPDHGATPVIQEIVLPNRICSVRPGQYIAVFDGRAGTMLRYDPAHSDLPPAVQTVAQEFARGFETDLIWFFPFFFVYPSESAGAIEWNGTKCHKLNVTLPLGTIAAYLVDASNFRVRLVAVDETYEGKTYHLEREWLDLSPVDGILLPKRMTYSGGEAKTAIAEVRTIEAERDQSIR